MSISVYGLDFWSLNQKDFYNKLMFGECIYCAKIAYLIKSLELLYTKSKRKYQSRIPRRVVLQWTQQRLCELDTILFVRWMLGEGRGRFMSLCNLTQCTSSVVWYRNFWDARVHSAGLHGWIFFFYYKVVYWFLVVI